MASSSRDMRAQDTLVALVPAGHPLAHAAAYPLARLNDDSASPAARAFAAHAIPQLEDGPTHG